MQANPFIMTLRFRLANRLVNVSLWAGRLALSVARPRDRDHFRRELSGVGS